MRHHLTERELIEYQFKLASDSRMKEAAEHLERCSRCRENLEQLNRKFSSLELLREEITVSDDLVSRVLEQADRPVQTRVVSFRKSAWLAGVAAVLFVGLLLLFADNIGRRFARKHEVPQMPELVPAAGTVGGEQKAVAALAKEPQGSVPDELGKPPFAPASAIELVTLPRRDNVQLTIYNATFQTRRGYGGFGGYGDGVYDGYGMKLDEAATHKAIEDAVGVYDGYGVKLDEATRKAIVEAVKDGHQISGMIPAGDLTLVRERRNLTLKKGWNWLQFMWANTLIDPTSLTLEPLEQRDKVTISQLVFPARLRELGRWLIRSETDGRVPFEITYFTSGLAWRAFYMGTLAKDEKTMHLQSYVRVDNNSGEDYENAQTRLLVGTVHILDQIAELARRQYPYSSPVQVVGDYSGSYGYGGYGGGGGYGGYGRYHYGDELKRKEIVKEGLSEYFLYTIEGTETIPNTWGKRLLSFEANDISVKSLYKYDEERWGQDTIRFVAFANDEKHNLGQTPIPNGDVRIYSQADDKEYLSYVGGTTVKYIPVNEEVELNLGPARLVTVEPKLMDFKTENYVFDSKRNVSGWDEVCQWQIEVTNTRELPIEVEITRGFGTAYWQMKFSEKDVSYEKYDVTHARFKLNLDPRSKRVFSYTVRTYHGEREQSLNK